MRKVAALAVAALLELLAGPASGQLETGSLYGTIEAPEEVATSRYREDVQRSLEGMLVQSPPPPWSEILERAGGLQAEEKWVEAEELLDLVLGSCSGPSRPACLRDVRFQRGYLSQERAAGLPAEERTGLLRAAAASYREALEAASEDPDVLENLALVLKDLGERREAVEILRRVGTLHPRRRFADEVTIGDLHFEAGELAPALESYDAAAALEPSREEVPQRIVAVFRRLPEERLHELTGRAEGWVRQGLTIPARDAFEQVLQRGFRHQPELAGEALARWADLQAAADLISRESLLQLPGPEAWPSPALRELHRLVEGREGAASSPVWWKASPARRHAAANVLRARARQLAGRRQPAQAARLLRTALDLAPELDDYARPELADRPLVPLASALEQVELHRDAQSLGGEGLQAAEEEISRMLARIEDGRDPETVRRAHAVLGLLAADQRRWTSPGQDGAIAHLERALGGTAAEPLLLETLARGYRETGRRDAALRALRDAAKLRLDRDDLAGAERVLAAARDLPPGTREARQVEALREIVAVRREIPARTAESLDARSRERSGLAGLFATGVFDDDPSFLRRQRFKALSDLGTRAAELGKPEEARLFHIRALQAASAEASLASVRDGVRLAEIRSTLLAEGWLRNAASSAAAGSDLAEVETRGGGWTWSISPPRQEPFQTWFSTDLLKAAEVASRLARDMRFAPGTVRLDIADGRVTQLPEASPEAGGMVLPGVFVTMIGPDGSPRVAVTNAQGQFRFHDLSPGSYQLKAELEGFETIEAPVEIRAGRSTAIDVPMAPAEEVIVITGEVPAFQPEDTLKNIPTARDPWTILSSTPDVLADRINVGGSDSGQQSQYIGSGPGDDQAFRGVNGAAIADMADLDDAFGPGLGREDGSDESSQRPGTNHWRVSARWSRVAGSWQSTPDVDAGELGRAGPWNASPAQPEGNAQAPIERGDRLVRRLEYGADIGGPIRKDRLWFWTSYERRKEDQMGLGEVLQHTEAELAQIKISAQLGASNAAMLTASHDDTAIEGLGGGPTRPQETTWRQSRPGGGLTHFKLEDTYVVSSDLYLTGAFTRADEGGRREPQGGLLATPRLDRSFSWHHTSLATETGRARDLARLDGTWFADAGDTGHMVKAGVGREETEASYIRRWGGLGIEYDASLFGTPLDVVRLTRDAAPAADLRTTYAYLQDELTWGNLTANLGVRWDRQGASLAASTARANPLFPNALPAVRFAGGDPGFDWETVSPRLALSYTFGSELQATLRAGFARYADALGLETASHLNPLSSESFLFGLTTNKGDGTLDPGQVLGLGVLPPSGNLDPRDGGLLQSNAVDPGLESPLTDELTLGLEYSLRPQLVVFLDLGWRRDIGLLELERLVFEGDPYAPENLDRIGRPHRRSDYRIARTVTGILPDGTTYSVPVYELRPGIGSRGGLFLENGDREQQLFEATLRLHKRLANRWMLRGAFGWREWEWEVPDSENEDPTLLLGGGVRDGDVVLGAPGDELIAGEGAYVNSRWSYLLTGLYQIAPDSPWGFDVVLGLAGREGSPVPYFRRIPHGSLQGIVGDVNVQATERPDSVRLDPVHTLDLRLQKSWNFDIFSRFEVSVWLDVRNVLNESQVLLRSYRLDMPLADHVLEIAPPRTLFLGARLVPR